MLSSYSKSQPFGRDSTQSLRREIRSFRQRTAQRTKACALTTLYINCQNQILPSRRRTDVSNYTLSFANSTRSFCHSTRLCAFWLHRFTPCENELPAYSKHSQQTQRSCKCHQQFFYTFIVTFHWHPDRFMPRRCTLGLQREARFCSSPRQSKRDTESVS